MYREDSTVVLVLDANIIKSLSMPVLEGWKAKGTATPAAETFLDVIKFICRLPNIEKVVLPDVVVWEAIGQINGEQVDKAYKNTKNSKNKDFEAINRFCKMAGRCDKEGTVLTVGEIEKLEIQATEHGEKYLEKVLEIFNSNQTLFQRIDRARHLRETEGQHLGEKVMTDYISHEKVHEGPGFFISNDREARDTQKGKLTPKGCPVGVVNLMGLIRATMQSGILRKTGIDTIDLPHVAEEFGAYYKWKNGGNIRPVEYVGNYKNGTRGDSLFAILERGMKMLEGRQFEEGNEAELSGDKLKEELLKKFNSGRMFEGKGRC